MHKFHFLKRIAVSESALYSTDTVRAQISIFLISASYQQISKLHPTSVSRRVTNTDFDDSQEHTFKEKIFDLEKSED